MRIEILGTESLGVRGLSCVVEAKDRKIVIDPGVALGYNRHGLLPHPLQVAVGESVRQKILSALEDTTDVVFSHFHGDHVPLVDANPFQMQAQKVAALCQTRTQKPRFWAKGPHGLSHNMTSRLQSLRLALDNDLSNAEGQKDGLLTFSLPVPHGQKSEHRGTVMMTRIEEGKEVFVHASDIQLLDEEAVSSILAWNPTIVLASGPPLYLPHLSQKQRKIAWHNAVRLAQEVDTLILDHHLMRSKGGARWLDKVSSITEHRVVCAADFLGRHRTLLEAWRQRLYAEMPVPEGWHEAYACGGVDTRPYRDWLYRVEDW
jgi:predicted metallo-beta-lactamase superfamily hydrolase